MSQIDLDHDCSDADEESETTTKLIIEVDAILSHIGGIDRILDGAGDVASADRRELRGTADQLFQKADRLDCSRGCARSIWWDRQRSWRTDWRLFPPLLSTERRSASGERSESVATTG